MPVFAGAQIYRRPTECLDFLRMTFNINKLEFIYVVVAEIGVLLGFS